MILSNYFTIKNKSYLNYFYSNHKKIMIKFNNCKKQK